MMWIFPHPSFSSPLIEVKLSECKEYQVPSVVKSIHYRYTLMATMLTITLPLEVEVSTS